MDSRRILVAIYFKIWSNTIAQKSRGNKTRPLIVRICVCVFMYTDSYAGKHLIYLTIKLNKQHKHPRNNNGSSTQE